MMVTIKKRLIRSAPLAACLFLSVLTIGSTAATRTSTQEPTPAVPDDATKIYYTDSNNKLVPLPFESSIDPLDPFVVAKSDRIGHAELKGLQAAITLTRDPRFY